MYLKLLFGLVAFILHPLLRVSCNVDDQEIQCKLIFHFTIIWVCVLAQELDIN